MSETKRDPDVTESCGCAFCDLGLDPDNSINGRPVHMTNKVPMGYLLCTHDELDELSEPTHD